MSDLLQQLRDAHKERLARLQGPKVQIQITITRKPDNPARKYLNLVTQTYERRSGNTYVPITAQNLLSRDRRMAVVKARDVAIYLTKTETDMPITKIGRVFGRSHTAVHYSVRRVQEQIARSERFKAEIERLQQRLKEAA